MADPTPVSPNPTPPAGPRSEAEILADDRLRERRAGYHAPANESAYRHEKSRFQWQEALIREGCRLLGEPDDIDF